GWRAAPAAARSWSWSAASGVADAIDASSLVVGHEQRAVRHDEDVGRTSPGAGALQPSFGERLVGGCAAALDLHEGHPVADRLAAVPGAVLADEDPAAILLREHRARVKAHA